VEYLLRHSMKTMELGVSSTFFLEQIHDGATGVGCVWRRKFGVELFFGSGAAWSSPKHALSTGCYLFPGKRKEEGGPISVINSIFLCATNNIFVKYEG
jgi:hypothetical protein